MKNDQLTTNSISESLLNKNTYYVLLTSRENSLNLRGDIALARREFFENGKKAVKISKEVSASGLNGNISGKLSRRNLIWKKTEGGIVTEECFKNRGVFVVAMRDLNGNLLSKIFYNKNMLWIKTEYYGISDFVTAQLIFKPVNTENAIERFTYNAEKKNYISELLYPVPYSYKSEESSFMNSDASGDILLVSTEDGEFAYCSKDEAESREKLMAELKESESLLESVWKNESEEENAIKSELDSIIGKLSSIGITSLSASQESKAADKEEKSEADLDNESSNENCDAVSEECKKADIPTEETETTEQNEKAEADSEERCGKAEPKAIQGKIEIEENFSQDPNEKYGDKLVYTGTLIEGKRNGRGRTDRKSGLTAFDGEYIDNKRNGFGCSYYKNGNLSYAGFWKDDKKDGMGVSFRNSDHAVQITSWKEGKPQCHSSVFDNEGYLKYTGNIVNGVKNGLCITYNKEEGGLFAGKWLQNGESGCGALFDSEGNLIYAGFLKDGKREGQGTEFDKNGEVVFTGTFKNDEYASGTLYKKI